MTTVIATPKGIYADTKCSYSVPFKVSKVSQIGSSVFAGAGDLDDLWRFLDWQRAGGSHDDLPTIDDGLDILEVCNGRIYLWGKKLVRVKLNETVYAIGSGAHYAMGALANGATPEQAIKIAAKYDPETALPLEFVGFKKVA